MSGPPAPQKKVTAAIFSPSLPGLVLAQGQAAGAGVTFCPCMWLMVKNVFRTTNELEFELRLHQDIACLAHLSFRKRASRAHDALGNLRREVAWTDAVEAYAPALRIANETPITTAQHRQ